MDVYFYHLEHQTLERVLPSLLEKTLARGWRAVVQVGSEDRLEALDMALWTYADDSFLAHGTARVGSASLQPIYLTLGSENPNGAGVRFLVDGAEAQEFAGAERFVYSQLAGRWRTAIEIGTRVYKDLVLGHLSDAPVAAPRDGVLRGIVRDGSEVMAGVKLLEIDPRGRLAQWTGIDERGRAIASATLTIVQRHTARAGPKGQKRIQNDHLLMQRYQ